MSIFSLSALSELAKSRSGKAAQATLFSLVVASSVAGRNANAAQVSGPDNAINDRSSHVTYHPGDVPTFELSGNPALSVLMDGDDRLFIQNGDELRYYDPVTGIFMMGPSPQDNDANVAMELEESYGTTSIDTAATERWAAAPEFSVNPDGSFTINATNDEYWSRDIVIDATNADSLMLAVNGATPVGIDLSNGGFAPVMDANTTVSSTQDVRTSGTMTQAADSIFGPVASAKVAPTNNFVSEFVNNLGKQPINLDANDQSPAVDDQTASAPVNNAQPSASLADLAKQAVADANAAQAEIQQAEADLVEAKAQLDKAQVAYDSAIENLNADAKEDKNTTHIAIAQILFDGDNLDDAHNAVIDEIEDNPAHVDALNKAIDNLEKAARSVKLKQHNQEAANDAYTAAAEAATQALNSAIDVEKQELDADRERLDDAKDCYREALDVWRADQGENADALKALNDAVKNDHHVLDARRGFNDEYADDLGHVDALKTAKLGLDNAKDNHLQQELSLAELEELLVELNAGKVDYNPAAKDPTNVSGNDAPTSRSLHNNDDGTTQTLDGDDNPPLPTDNNSDKDGNDNPPPAGDHDNDSKSVLERATDLYNSLREMRGKVLSAFIPESTGSMVKLGLGGAIALAALAGCSLKAIGRYRYSKRRTRLVDAINELAVENAKKGHTYDIKAAVDDADKKLTSFSSKRHAKQGSIANDVQKELDDERHDEHLGDLEENGLPVAGTPRARYYRSLDEYRIEAIARELNDFLGNNADATQKDLTKVVKQLAKHYTHGDRQLRERIFDQVALQPGFEADGDLGKGFAEARLKLENEGFVKKITTFVRAGKGSR